jgi:predicted AAA+ superfamily ATPase
LVNQITEMIKRALSAQIKSQMGSGKAIVLIGPRQVGKTTLIQTLLADIPHAYWDGDDALLRGTLNQAHTGTLKMLLGTHTTLFIDEAQRIENAGLLIKILVDQFKHVQVLVSGSSALTLKAELLEPLTGRMWLHTLYPISWGEWEAQVGHLGAIGLLENQLVTGMYPEVLNHPNQAQERIKQLTEGYLYRDVLAMAQIKKPQVLDKLLRALAHQVGAEVSYNELAQLLGVDKNTVAKYIDLLIKSYVVFPLGSYSGNLRNEIKRKQKMYFWDNGLRNAILGDFTPWAMRQDQGALWENFLISERLKRNSYHNHWVSSYFWRNINQQEIDYLEYHQGRLYAYEIKWSPKANVRTPKNFKAEYQTEVTRIDRSNFSPLLQ